MSQNITWLGASYSTVPFVSLPKTGGGTARFDDASVTTATAADVASGKVFVASDGTITTGTASGGGGGSNWTLLGSTTLTINTTSTSAASAGTIECGSAAYTAANVIWVHIRGQSGKRNGYFYGSDAIFVNYQAANGGTNAFAAPAVEYIRVSSSGSYTTASGSYGVYGYQINSSGKVTIRQRYNSANTLTINDTFDCEVYALTMPTGKTLFT